MSIELDRLRKTVEKAVRVTTAQRLTAEEVPLELVEEVEDETEQSNQKEEQPLSE